jgi:hypothetical protein
MEAMWLRQLAGSTTIHAKLKIDIPVTVGSRDGEQRALQRHRPHPGRGMRRGACRQQHRHHARPPRARRHVQRRVACQLLTCHTHTATRTRTCARISDSKTPRCRPRRQGWLQQSPHRCPLVRTSRRTCLQRNPRFVNLHSVHFIHCYTPHWSMHCIAPHPHGRRQVGVGALRQQQLHRRRTALARQHRQPGGLHAAC